MDTRRLKLYELLKPKLDEEPARALVLAHDERMRASRRWSRHSHGGCSRSWGAWTILVGSTIGWVAALFR